jgi:hypothetical protein
MTPGARHPRSSCTSHALRVARALVGALVAFVLFAAASLAPAPSLSALAAPAATTERVGTPRAPAPVARLERESPGPLFISRRAPGAGPDGPTPRALLCVFASLAPPRRGPVEDTPFLSRRTPGATLGPHAIRGPPPHSHA